MKSIIRTVVLGCSVAYAFVPLFDGRLKVDTSSVKTVESVQRQWRTALFSSPENNETLEEPDSLVEVKEQPKPKKMMPFEFEEKTDEEVALLNPVERDQYEKAKEAARLRAAEKFIVKKTGDYECRSCSYVYLMAKNDRAFDDLPGTWKCPVCRAPKESFLAVEKIIAGFEENQGYGFGTNAMTGGQKNLLIFGGLGLFLALFLLGYALD